MKQKEVKIVKGIKIITQYKTSDNELFTDINDANKHQEELNNFDYKKGYYKLLKKVEQLESALAFEKSIKTFSFKDITTNNNQKPVIIKYEGKNTTDLRLN